jgi:hypothetical protein
MLGQQFNCCPNIEAPGEHTRVYETININLEKIPHDENHGAKLVPKSAGQFKGN